MTTWIPAAVTPAARLPPDLRARVARCDVVAPAPPGADIEPRHAPLLDALCDAVDGRGLPRVGGFTFDPADVAATLDPTPGWPVLAVHPRFGALRGMAQWSLASTLSARHRRHEAPRFEEPTALGSSWHDALRWVLDLDDATRRRWAVWIALGPATPHDGYGAEPTYEGRFEALRWVQRGARNALADALAAALSLSPATRGCWRRDGLPVLWRLGADVLLTSDDADDVDRALRWATPRDLAAQPETTCVELPYGQRGEAPADPGAYHVSHRTPHGELTLDAHRDPARDAWVWTMSQSSTVCLRRVVRASTVARGEAFSIDGASPRLRAYLGRHGVVRVASMRDVDAVRAWAPAGWEALVAVEAQLGGFAMPALGGLGAPEHHGVHAMLRERDALEPTGLASNEDDSETPHGLPWPFVRTHGRELAVVGVVPDRCHMALCADRDGVIYLLDHEFGSLTPMAVTARGYLERTAFFTEQFVRPGAMGSHPALAIDAWVDDALLDGLGARAVPEASDAVSRWDLGDDAMVHRRAEHPPQRASTWLYTPRAEHALTLARRVRAEHPSVRMQVRWGNDAASEARRAAFAESELRDLDTRGWHDFGVM